MVYTISYILAKYLVKIFFAGEGYGQENFPRKKPFIAVFNHNSNFDVLSLSLVVKFRAMGMGKMELFEVPALKWWLRKINVYPIIRGASDTEGFELIEQELKKGNILFISPEGTRKWKDGRPPRPKLGFVRLAQAVKCPIVPVGIVGTRDILPPGAIIPRWQKVVVRVGKPLRLASVELKMSNRDILQKQANLVMKKVYELLPEWARPNSEALEKSIPESSSLIFPYENNSL